MKLYRKEQSDFCKYTYVTEDDETVEVDECWNKGPSSTLIIALTYLRIYPKNENDCGYMSYLKIPILVECE